MNKSTLTIALSKGRILKETLPLFNAAGYTPSEDVSITRKLIIPSAEDADVRFLIVRASDVATYVQYGAADVGVVGKDGLIEHGGTGLYEPLDLGIAKCKLMVAGFPETDLNPGKRLKVATKYVNVARQYFAEKGCQVEMLKLYGSMELAPLVGLADCIVDLVDTGNTLKANGLVPLELIMHISSRLIVNEASMKLKSSAIKQLLAKIQQVV